MGHSVRGLLDRLPKDMASERDTPEPQAEPPEPETPKPGAPLPVDYVACTLARLLPERAIVTDEASSHMSITNRYLRTEEPGSHFVTGSGGLGFSMPAAVGLQLGQPERQVVCVVGDGASLYAPQALWSAVQYGAPVVFVVINNSQYGILKAFSQFIQTGEKIPSLDLPGLEITSISRGFGCEAERVEHPEELQPAIERALATDGPYLLEVVVERKVESLV